MSREQDLTYATCVSPVEIGEKARADFILETQVSGPVIFPRELRALPRGCHCIAARYDRPPHADPAVRPGLPGNPLDGVVAVFPFAGQEAELPLGVARPRESCAMKAYPRAAYVRPRLAFPKLALMYGSP